MKKTTTSARLLAFFSSLLLLLFGSTGSAYAQASAPTWQTVVAAAGSTAQDYCIVRKIATAENGDVYIAGEFAGVLNLGDTTLLNRAGVVTDGSPRGNVFVAKWSQATKAFVWATQAGGSFFDNVSGLAVEGKNLYMSGRFGTAAVTYGGRDTTFQTDSPRGFVAKLVDEDVGSRFAWLEVLSSTIKALALQGRELYIGGDFSSSTLTIGDTTLTNSSRRDGPFGAIEYDGYVAALSDEGRKARFRWAQQIKGFDRQFVEALAVQETSVYVTGTFTTDVTVGSTTLLNAGQQEDVVVARFTDQGKKSRVDWVERMGGPGQELVKQIAVNGASVYLAGDFTGNTSVFGPSTLNRVSTLPGVTDAFLVKLTDTGISSSFTWVYHIADIPNEVPESLAVVGNRLYLGGRMSLAGKPFSVAQFTDTGPSARLDWTEAAVGTANVFALAVRGTSVYVGGLAVPPVRFGGITLDIPMVRAAGFLALLGQSGTPLATATATPLAGLHLYPNPARATTTVVIPKVIGATEATLTLTDAVGRVVRTQRVPLYGTGVNTELSLSGLRPTLYWVKVQAGNHYATQTLAVE